MKNLIGTVWNIALHLLLHDLICVSDDFAGLCRLVNATNFKMVSVRNIQFFMLAAVLYSTVVLAQAPSQAGTYCLISY